MNSSNCFPRPINKPNLKECLINTAVDKGTELTQGPVLQKLWSKVLSPDKRMQRLDFSHFAFFFCRSKSLLIFRSYPRLWNPRQLIPKLLIDINVCYLATGTASPAFPHEATRKISQQGGDEKTYRQQPLRHFRRIVTKKDAFIIYFFQKHPS